MYSLLEAVEQHEKLQTLPKYVAFERLPLIQTLMEHALLYMPVTHTGRVGYKAKDCRSVNMTVTNFEPNGQGKLKFACNAQ